METLPQEQADRLRAMPKRLLVPPHIALPPAGESMTWEVESLDHREKFHIDANRRGKFVLQRCTYQERYRIVDILLRLDVGGPPHTNPNVEELTLPMLAEYNGSILPCPHLHIYVEGFDDRWAIPAPVEISRNTSDLTETLVSFMKY